MKEHLSGCPRGQDVLADCRCQEIHDQEYIALNRAGRREQALAEAAKRDKIEGRDD